MKVVFSDHAESQLTERNIPKAEVIKTIKHPHQTIFERIGRWRAVRKIRRRNKNYVLVVIYDRSNSAIEVVTEFITSKINKYL